MTPAASPFVTSRARPFRGLRFAGADEVVGLRTFSPPDTWTTAPPPSPEHPSGLRTLLGSALGAPGPGSAETLDSWLVSGVLERDHSPAMYVYRRTDEGGASLTGVVCAVTLDEGVLLPHEQVLPQVVEAQSELELGTHAQWEPIVAMCPGPGRITALVRPVTVREPEIRLVENRVRHELWVVTDPATHQQVDAAARTDPWVIADGHHRFEAWRRRRGRQGPWAWGMAMLVDTADLRLGPVHRVVDATVARRVLASAGESVRSLDTTGDARAFIAEASAARGHRLAVVVDGTAFAVDTPDCAVQWLHQEMPPPTREGTIDYVHDADAAVDLAKERDGAAILMAAPSTETVVEAALRGTRLPHKATSFGPKPRVGLVLRHWAEGADDVTGR